MGIWRWTGVAVSLLLTVTVWIGCDEASTASVGNADAAGETLVSCVYGGSSYASGDSFSATDGCNSCTCEEDGSVVCTMMYCGTDLPDNPECADACGEGPPADELLCQDGKAGVVDGCDISENGVCEWNVICDEATCGIEDCGDEPDMAACPDGNSPQLTCENDGNGACAWVIGNCGSAPCELAECGAPCSICDPEVDETCDVQTSEGVCDADAECVVSIEDGAPCDEELCLEVVCPAVTELGCDGNDLISYGMGCDPETGECVPQDPMFMKDCSDEDLICLNGQCVVDEDCAGVICAVGYVCVMGACEYNACQGLACGADCVPCAPDEEDCAYPELPMMCNSAGDCVTAFNYEMECGSDLCSDVVCPSNPAYCDGNTAYAASYSICEPSTGECLEAPAQAPEECEQGSVCVDGACVDSDASSLCEKTGGFWNECGSGCGPVTCENPIPGEICPDICVPQCSCPKSKSIWDEELGCIALETCEEDLCEGVVCKTKTPFCEGDVAHPGTEGQCNVKTGQCEEVLMGEPEDCGAKGMVCLNGSCLKPGATDQGKCGVTGGNWTACGSGCGPATCSNPNPGPLCPTICVEMCECPAEKPIWDADKGCIPQDECPSEPVKCKEPCEPVAPYCEGSMAYGVQEAKCHPVTGECKFAEKPVPVDCAKSGTKCLEGKCVDGNNDGEQCDGVLCPNVEPFCDGDFAHSGTFSTCDPATGQCVFSPGAPPQDCGSMGMACQDGSCVPYKGPEALCAVTGGEWNMCGSGCGPLTCNNSNGGGQICPSVCTPLCQCPEGTPLWDEVLGCISEEECKIVDSF